MKLFLNKRRPALWFLFMMLTVCSARAVTLDELREDAWLTPEGLIRRFSTFKFKLFDELQPRTDFLATQQGDCDDFATLAADVLQEKGYTTSLIAVFMEQQVHVVCYVKEAGAYLDYNYRKKPSPLVPTNGKLADIATKVARSFHQPWMSVLQYTYQNGVKHTVQADFPTQPG